MVRKGVERIKGVGCGERGGGGVMKNVKKKTCDKDDVRRL